MIEIGLNERMKVNLIQIEIYENIDKNTSRLWENCIPGMFEEVQQNY